MTKVEIRDAIMDRIGANHTSTPIHWPNKFFKPATQATDGKWIKPSLVFGDTQVGEVGSDGVGLRFGILFISIFTKRDDGQRNADIIVDLLETLFRRESVDGVYFEEPSSNDLGIDKITDKNHTQVKVPFWTWVGE